MSEQKRREVREWKLKVKDIMQLGDSTGLTRQQIADELNKAGLKTSKGYTWTQPAVSSYGIKCKFLNRKHYRARTAKASSKTSPKTILRKGSERDDSKSLIKMALASRGLSKDLKLKIIGELI